MRPAIDQLTSQHLCIAKPWAWRGHTSFLVDLNRGLVGIDPNNLTNQFIVTDFDLD